MFLVTLSVQTYPIKAIMDQQSWNAQRPFDPKPLMFYVTSFTLLYTFGDTIPYDTQCNDQIFHYNHINWNWWNEVHRKLKSSDHWITKVFRLSDLLCHLKFDQCLNRNLIGNVLFEGRNLSVLFGMTIPFVRYPCDKYM